MAHPRPSRRTLLRSSAVLAALALTDGCSAAGGPDASPEPPLPPVPPGAAGAAQARVMPAETGPHARTFMAWPASAELWGEQLPGVRQEVAEVARAVAGFEPVVLLARPDQADQARQACGSSVEVLELKVDDLWARGSGPTFVTGPRGPAAIDFNFNGWGDKQTHANDALVARYLLDHYRVTRVQAPVTGEGGGFEVDGEGTLLATESSWVNGNRNPGASRDRIEEDLKALLGAEKVIWFQGAAWQDLTDCHVDTLARFAEPGTVLLHRPAAAAQTDTRPDAQPDIRTAAADQAAQVLRSETDAKGRAFTVVDLPGPDLGLVPGAGRGFLATYVNYYVCNGGVIVPRFGDRAADERAAAVIGEQHPGRTVAQVDIGRIAAVGGGIHCLTQQQPAPGA
ncbi:agmatine deiminase family protein [Kitasatospora sp. NPDC004799]|uniref:agmatine deiminase family protein n=1 Tax=Kitasatospora sp. NPDC004799 TaxID=3154460 RepID=UPI0033BAEBBC